MDTLVSDRRGSDVGDRPPGGDDDGRMPHRRKRQLLTPPSALVGALLACAIGFYGGVRLEKSQVSTSTTTLAASGSSAATGTARGQGTAGRAGGSGAGGFAGAGGYGGGSANRTLGTVQSVKGGTLTVTETSGNTVQVDLISATKVSKTQSAKRSAVHPGDTVVIAGAPNAKGTIVAQTLTDSGAGRSFGGSAGSGSTGGSGSSSGSGSGVSSLFGSGG
ncbi:MAG: hypothetical protein JOZ07_19655 [Solirubrobacterales bacterium]|nr:hypothetical protein [Solirubrobacterales bacterium]